AVDLVTNFLVRRGMPLPIRFRGSQTLLQTIHQVVQASSDLAVAILRPQGEAFSEWCRHVEEDHGATEQQEVEGDRRPITNQHVCRLQDRLGVRVLRRWHRDYVCMR